MESTLNKQSTGSVITSTELLAHWLGHRNLTRRVIEAFPENALFEHSIGEMRTFSGMLTELLAIGAPGMRQIAYGKTEELNEHIEDANTKEKLLSLWDKDTEEIRSLWQLIPDEKFSEPIVTFGKYEGTVQSSILYFIDNEIHHRAQGIVYLRSLGINPPFFWER